MVLYYRIYVIYCQMSNVIYSGLVWPVVMGGRGPMWYPFIRPKIPGGIPEATVSPSTSVETNTIYCCKKLYPAKKPGPRFFSRHKSIVDHHDPLHVNPPNKTSWQQVDHLWEAITTIQQIHPCVNPSAGLLQRLYLKNWKERWFCINICSILLQTLLVCCWIFI